MTRFTDSGSGSSLDVQRLFHFDVGVAPDCSRP